MDRYWQRKFVVFSLIGLLSTSLFPFLVISHARAGNPQLEIGNNRDGVSLEAKGQEFYLSGNFSQAIAFWQQAVMVYQETQEVSSQAKVLSNLALAYHQLGNESQAQELILLSRNLLEAQDKLGDESQQTLAQVLNNQGIIQLAQGNPQEAIALWQQAQAIYQTLEDESGTVRTAINLASALKNLGLYRRALKILAAVEPILVTQPDSSLKAAGLRSYGNILRLIGNTAKAETVLNASLAVATQLDGIQDRVKTLLTLGDTLAITPDRSKAQRQQEALELYQQALVSCQSSTYCASTSLPLQINLAQFNLLLKTDYWWQAAKLIPEVSADFNSLPDNQTQIERKINFANSLIELKQKTLQEQPQLQNIPSWSEIETIVAEIVLKSSMSNSSRTESYGLGLQGKIAEQQQQWLIAATLTQQALNIAEGIKAAEISYLWQWQLGRIYSAQGDILSAISNYSNAITNLQDLSQDLVAIDANIQYSFQESVEPVYRQLIDLLLRADSGVSQENLQQAREVIESLQLAELNNFFREACLDTKPVQIDQIDPQAAAIYPIILPDRLEIILSLPHQPLTHYSVAVSQELLEQEIAQFRQTVVVRSRRAFYEPARKLYNWLISPEIDILKANNIQTLVIVPDGLLRNIPLSALSDGEQFLIENYNVVLTSGLQLLSPRSLTDIKLKTLAAGLTESRQGFPALDFVNQELVAIQTQTDSQILVNQEFTTQTFKQEIKLSDYPIVHIATHGQFGASLDSTFLLAWDDKITINQLDNMLQGRNPAQKQAIELLVLSACETAAGERQAALGLAGMAVRAGARSTVATLWSVNDEATAQMMSHFYQQLATQQVTKAEAVRKAQLTLLNSSWYSHPFYWSPYVLLGNWL
ncbi:MAG TPA: CHAT domain-containing protein [Xenococcaceae cyanobacterium]